MHLYAKECLSWWWVFTGEKSGVELAWESIITLLGSLPGQYRLTGTPWPAGYRLRSHHHVTPLTRKERERVVCLCSGGTSESDNNPEITQGEPAEPRRYTQEDFNDEAILQLLASHGEPLHHTAPALSLPCMAR